MLRLGLATAVVIALVASPVWQASGQQNRIELPKPQCTAQTKATAAQTEGPFYKAGSPQRTRLAEPNAVGTKLSLSGYVLARGSCFPVVNAWLDFWQADEKGNYDNAGYRLRGHQVTSSAGVYQLETILPGLYPGRTRHIHVKVRAPGGPILTTQLYFPGEARNQEDSILNPALLMTVQDTSTGKVATFSFIVETR